MLGPRSSLIKCFYLGGFARKEGAMADEARVRKVQERILQTIASMIGRHVKDPRLELVTITDSREIGRASCRERV